MSELTSPQTFGCIACWPRDAGAAWEARRGLHPGPELVDVLPLHAAELAALGTLDRANLIARIAEIGGDRVCLQRDFPKGSPPPVGWGIGVVLP